MMRAFTERILDYIENFTSNFCRVVQYALIILVFGLICLFSYIYIHNLLNAHKRDQLQPYQLYLYTVSGVWILYNILFNYIMCYCTGPGYPQNIRSSHFPQRVTKRCRKCNERKPQRCHHCSICNKCILQMDHHCPWMGTCIGHQNRRFFVNFLTYVCFGICLILYLLKSVHARNVTDSKTFLSVLLLCLSIFCAFHWILIFIGRTTLELCVLDGYKPECGFIKNLRIVYGTANILKLLMPIRLKLPFEGFEWTSQTEDVQVMNESISD